jgi:hypothetical protein
MGSASIIEEGREGLCLGVLGVHAGNFLEESEFAAVALVDPRVYPTPGVWLVFVELQGVG